MGILEFFWFLVTLIEFFFAPGCTWVFMILKEVWGWVGLFWFWKSVGHYVSWFLVSLLLEFSWFLLSWIWVFMIFNGCTWVFLIFSECSWAFMIFNQCNWVFLILSECIWVFMILVFLIFSECIWVYNGCAWVFLIFNHCLPDVWWVDLSFYDLLECFWIFLIFFKFKSQIEDPWQVPNCGMVLTRSLQIWTWMRLPDHFSLHVGSNASSCK